MKKLVASILVLLASAVAFGHHSYAMFDGSKVVTVSGVVAKLDWSNPHVFIWVYVPNPKSSSGHDLYAFANASTNVLTRAGWTAKTLTAGEKVTVEYWPLKDGRTGGQLIKVTHEDGHVSRGIGGPNGVKDAPETSREK